MRVINKRYHLLLLGVVKKVLSMSIWFAIIVFLSTMGCVTCFNYPDVEKGARITAGYTYLPIMPYERYFILSPEIGGKIGPLKMSGSITMLFKSNMDGMPLPMPNMKLQILSFVDTSSSLRFASAVGYPPNIGLAVNKFKRPEFSIYLNYCHWVVSSPFEESFQEFLIGVRILVLKNTFILLEGVYYLPRSSFVGDELGFNIGISREEK